MHQSHDVHWTTVKHILRYVRGTIDYGLLFQESCMITSLVGCRRKKVWCLDLLLRWSLANATFELTWFRSLLVSVKLSGTPVIWCDNASTISLAANLVLPAKVKHVELYIHFVCSTRFAAMETKCISNSTCLINFMCVLFLVVIRLLMYKLDH